MKLADASFLIDYARGDDAAIAYLAAHDSEEIGAPTISLELLARSVYHSSWTTPILPLSRI